MKYLKPLDYVAVAGVLLFALFAALPILWSERGDHAVIESESGTIVAPLYETREYVVTSHGYTLTVKVTDGSVSVISSDCPDRLCENSPPISRAGMTIICVPARLIIYIEGDINANAVAG